MWQNKVRYRLISDFVKNAAGLVFKWVCQIFTTVIRWAAAGFWGAPGQLEPQAAIWWHWAAGLIAYWKAWKTKNMEMVWHKTKDHLRETMGITHHTIVWSSSRVCCSSTLPLPRYTQWAQELGRWWDHTLHSSCLYHKHSSCSRFSKFLQPVREMKIGSWSSTETLEMFSKWGVTSLGRPSGPVQPVIKKIKESNITLVAG